LSYIYILAHIFLQRMHVNRSVEVIKAVHGYLCGSFIRSSLNCLTQIVVLLQHDFLLYIKQAVSVYLILLISQKNCV